MLVVHLTAAWAQGNADASFFTFGGQFRLNAFAESSLGAFPDTLLGERLRLRPTARFSLRDRVKGMLQLEANQVDNAFAFRARYADASVRLGPTELHVGLLPLSDRFGDTLFSADWDFNPLALSLVSEEGPWKGRIAAGLIYQGALPTVWEDDVGIALADVDRGPAGGSIVAVRSAPGAAIAPDTTLVIPGLRFEPEVGEGRLELAAMGSGLWDSAGRSFGGAARVELVQPVGGATASLLALYATGGGRPDGVGRAFTTPMSLFGFHGYWGYTGRLTVQGPTDQGMDDPYNIDGGTYDRSNLGRGMATAQARLSGSVRPQVALAAAAGVFGAAEGGLYGVDGLGQLTWKPEPEVALDVIGTLTAFGDAHHARAGSTAIALASRLQLEF